MNEQLRYGFDPAGNLNYRTNNTLVENFQVNSLNELTANTNGGRLTVVGTTTSSATNVTVNGTNALRYNDATFAATNMPLTTTYTAIASDSYGRHSTNATSVSLSTNVAYQYDGNGNLTNDGLRNFVYDDENELVQVFVSNQWKSVFSYDGKMRRRIRQEYVWQSGIWDLQSEIRYVYDGNEVVQERDQNNLPTVTYTRGKDLSGLAPWDAQLSHTGSLEGAGGIGGLLARTDNTGGQTAYYHADGNGNITMLINASQAIVAKYLYDAFGNVLSAAGSLAQANLYRFSSKEAHVNSGLVYYLYRFYDPNLQRWPNRDPIQEQGGVNLYEFVGNHAVMTVDTFGLSDIGTAVPGSGGQGGNCLSYALAPCTKGGESKQNQGLGPAAGVTFKGMKQAVDQEMKNHGCQQLKSGASCGAGTYQVNAYYWYQMDPPPPTPPYHCIRQDPDGTWSQRNGPNQPVFGGAPKPTNPGIPGPTQLGPVQYCCPSKPQ